MEDWLHKLAVICVDSTDWHEGGVGWSNPNRRTVSQLTFEYELQVIQ
jgi:hypothetical protein